MRTGRKVFWLVLPFIAACSGIEVQVVHDDSVDFSRYHTFHWVKKPAIPGNPVNSDQIIVEIDGQLYAKGWRRVAEGQGDAAIAAHVATDEQQRIDTMYHYIPDWGGIQWWSDWAGEGMRTPSAVTYYTVGTLIVDIFDAKSRKDNGFTSIWHGTAAGTVSNDLQENQRKIKEAVQEMFKNFPSSGATSSPLR